MRTPVLACILPLLAASCAPPEETLPVDELAEGTTHDFEPLAEPPESCRPQGRLAIDISLRIRNAFDVGVGGHFWAYDHLRPSIQLWEAAAGSFCAIVRDSGAFVTAAGRSPAGGGMIRAGIRGTFAGASNATVRGALRADPGYPPRGDLGTFDYRCDPATGMCPGLFNWLQTYFEPGVARSSNWWIWIYFAGRNGLWVNSSGGNLGDIHN